MKKVIVFAFLPWLFSAFGYKALAQEDNLKKEEKKETQEIIIRKKGDKDANIRVEITGDKVLINGKPLVEFNDDNITVNKRKIIINDGNRIMFGDGMDELKVLGYWFIGAKSITQMVDLKTISNPDIANNGVNINFGF